MCAISQSFEYVPRKWDTCRLVCLQEIGEAAWHSTVPCVHPCGELGSLIPSLLCAQHGSPHTDGQCARIPALHAWVAMDIGG